MTQLPNTPPLAAASAPTPVHPGARVWIALAIALLCWASSFPAIRYAVHHGFPRLELALMRMLSASIALAVYALAVQRVRMPPRELWPRQFAMAVLGITAYHLLLNLGASLVTAGATSLLVNTNPIFAALLSVAFLGERLSKWGWVGTAVSFAGVAMIALGEGHGIRLAPGALLLVAAALCWSGYIVVQKSTLARMRPLDATTFSIWIGTFMLLGFAPSLWGILATAPLPVILWGAYLGVFPTAITYVLWSYVLAHYPASRAANFLFLIPALSIVIAWLWMNEIPSTLSICGGAIVLAGVAMVNWLGKPRTG